MRVRPGINSNASLLSENKTNVNSTNSLNPPQSSKREPPPILRIRTIFTERNPTNVPTHFQNTFLSRFSIEEHIIRYFKNSSTKQLCGIWILLNETSKAITGFCCKISNLAKMSVGSLQDERGPF